MILNCKTKESHLDKCKECEDGFIIEETNNICLELIRNCKTFSFNSERKLQCSFCTNYTSLDNELN